MEDEGGYVVFPFPQIETLGIVPIIDLEADIKQLQACIEQVAETGNYTLAQKLSDELTKLRIQQESMA